MSRRKQWASDSSVFVDLSAGASVEMTFKGNLFELTEDERQLIGSLSSVIQKYKDAVLEQAESAARLPLLEVRNE